MPLELHISDTADDESLRDKQPTVFHNFDLNINSSNGVAKHSMSFFLRAIRTQWLWLQFRQYQRVKDETFNLTNSQKFKRKSHTAAVGYIYSILQSFQTDNTSLNNAWVGCKGFAGGVAISWVVFLFLVVALRVSLAPATWVSSALTVFLSFGLAFSSVVRCYTLMLLPQLFSKRGRQAITAYAFVLAVSGPAYNCLHNIGVLSDSLACGQDQVKRAMRQVSDMVQAPMRAMKETMKTLVSEIRTVVQPVKDVITRFAQVVTSVLKVMEKATKWLASVTNICNKEVGSPYQRCLRVFNDAVADCRVKLGLMKFLCEIVTWVQPLCAAAKAVDALCMITDLVSDAVIGTVKRRLASFRQHMEDMFAVSIHVTHSMDMESTMSRSVESVVSSIVKEVEQAMSRVKWWFSWAPMLPSFAFLLLILKLMRYRQKFLTSDSFDNKYITRRIVELDLLRREDAVLPLEPNEKALYTTATSIRLIRGERRKLVTAFVFLSLTTVQVSCYLICDYGLFWTLTLIRKQGEAQRESDDLTGDLPVVGANIEGAGALADLYSRLADSFQVPPANINLDPTPCLPQPMTPDYRGYIQIGVLLLLCWSLAVTEPYGLRMRHVVMSYYYPERAKQRAAWLYNHILRSRGSFIQFARRQIQNRLAEDTKETDVTLWQRIIHRNAFLTKIFGSDMKCCVACATPGTIGQSLAPCTSFDCTGLFCPACLSRYRACPLCRHQFDSDYIDFSEEEDSSCNTTELECSLLEESSVEDYDLECGTSTSVWSHNTESEIEELPISFRVESRYDEYSTYDEIE